MHKVACVVIHDYYGDYDSESIVKHMTDFIEVDDETFKNLKVAGQDYKIQQKLGHNFYVVEQLSEQTVAETIQQYIEIANVRAAEEARRKEERERKAAEAKIKRLANSKKKKEERIAKLKAELEELESI